MKIKALLLIFILAGNFSGQTKEISGESDFDRLLKYHKNSINKAARKIKISPLVNKKIENNEAELRIWMIMNKFGAYWVECFVIRKENEQMKAVYITGFNQPKKFTFKEFDLPEPENGWENLNNYLKANNIDFDLQLTPEGNGPAPDGEEIAIEAKVGNKYNFYYYEKDTRNKDGKIVQNLCKKIVKEFDLQGLFPKESKVDRLKCTY